MHDIQSAAGPLLPLLPAKAWLPWKAVRRPNGKFDKVPTMGATTNAPASWLTFDAALDALRDESKDIAGLGFAIAAGTITLDFDNCRDPVTGRLTDEAQAELERFNSYAYVTPSGKGFRIVGSNSAATPIRGQKANLTLPGGTWCEAFVGPTNHFNTLTDAVIPGYEVVRDISSEVLDYLAAFPRRSEIEKGTPAEPQRCIEAIRAALRVIPNSKQDWDHWSYVGMATWRASGGSEGGLDAWIGWSRKHPLHDPAACSERWQHWFRSPPSRLGFGTLYHMARQTNPLFVPPFDPPEFADRQGPTIDEFGDPVPPQPDADVRRLPLVYFGDIQPNLDAADFVEGLLIRSSLAVVYGESNCGKTFFVADLCLHLAMMKEWRGRAMERGAVIYVALEGIHGISNRVAAFRKHHGLEGVEIPFAVIPMSINLLNPEADTVPLINAIKEAAAHLAETVSLVVIDTLSRAMAGGNENSSDDMGAIVTNADLIRQQTGAALVFVHHSGKDAAKGARGHSLLRAATDTEIEITREDKHSPSVATVRKQREMETEGEFIFRLQTVELGVNRRGKPVTSCVVIPMEPGEVIPPTASAFGIPSDPEKPKVTKLKLNNNAQIGLNALHTALNNYGKLTPATAEYPQNVVCVNFRSWKAEFTQQRSELSEDSLKKSFARATEELSALKIVYKHNELVWLASKRFEAEQ